LSDKLFFNYGKRIIEVDVVFLNHINDDFAGFIRHKFRQTKINNTIGWSEPVLKKKFTVIPVEGENGAELFHCKIQNILIFDTAIIRSYGQNIISVFTEIMDTFKREILVCENFIWIVQADFRMEEKSRPSSMQSLR